MKKIILASTFLLVGLTSRAADNPGAVYTMDNSSVSNQLLVYDRAADGRLSLAGEIATGGVGTGGGLGSQGALAKR